MSTVKEINQPIIKKVSNYSLSADSQGFNWRSAREKLLEYSLLTTTIFASAIVLIIIFFVAQKAWPIFKYNGLGFIFGSGWDQQINASWSALTPKWKFGAFPIIAGSIMTTGGALLLTTIFGLGCAIFLAELSPRYLRKPFETMVRLLAAVPSVVFGLIGLLVVVPFIQKYFISNELALKYAAKAPLDGHSYLAGVVVLTFMIMPFFISMAADAIKAVPHSYKYGSLALGATHWSTIMRIIIPSAIPGIVAGLILASARAIGEAIALSMVTGSIAFLPNPAHGLPFFVEPLRTMAATIVSTGDGMGVKTIESAAFALGTLLLISSLILSLAARVTLQWFSKKVATR